MTSVWSPDPLRGLAERAWDDFGVFAYDGFGIMLSDEQLEARAQLGRPGPRESNQTFKLNWLSGGQRSGKTTLVFLWHAEAGLYKVGQDGTDRAFWRNYQYGTLHIAPTEELAMRLYTIAQEIAKGSSDAQYDRRARRSRGGAFLRQMSVGKSGPHGIVRFTNGSFLDFRSSEGYATRLEGGQWWFISWDEWATQPAREIRFVLRDVLWGRARDHDAKIVPLAWPKPATESNLIAVIRAIERGEDRDSQVIYLDASKAYFTNQAALATEIANKDAAEVSRTVRGRPAGGASIEFKDWMLDNLWRRELRLGDPPVPGWVHFSSWDLGLAHDSTVGHTFAIPVVDGKPRVSPQFKARVVNVTELPGGPTLTPDLVGVSISREQAYYRSETALDATAMGGVAAVRQLRDLRPPPLSFVSRSNDRIVGNMRLAAIANGLDVLAWGREQALVSGGPWGLVESPFVQQLSDQLALFDRDAKDIPDDWVWSFLIGLWYIRRYWAIGAPGLQDQLAFNVAAPERKAEERVPPAVRRRARRGNMIEQTNLAIAPEGVRYLIVRK